MVEEKIRQNIFNYSAGPGDLFLFSSGARGKVFSRINNHADKILPGFISLVYINIAFCL